MSSIHFTRATLAQLPAIQRTGKDSYAPYYQHVWYPGGVDWYIEFCFNETILTEELSDPSIEYYLPTDTEGHIIGLVKIHPLKPTPDGSISNALYVEKIYLLPDFFGQGMGQVLLNIIEQKALELGRTALWLQVMHNPGPIGAYANAGFRITAPTHFPHDLLKEAERDGWVMVKILV